MPPVHLPDFDGLRQIIEMNVEHSTSNIEPFNTEKRSYDLDERLLDYSVRIIRLVEALPQYGLKHSKLKVEC